MGKGGKMMEWFMELDAGILLFLQENVRNEILTPVLALLTTLGNAAAVWIAISLVLLLFRKTGGNHEPSGASGVVPAQ